jgi:tetratricopeptide (TPR) repeat protein
MSVRLRRRLKVMTLGSVACVLSATMATAQVTAGRRDAVTHDAQTPETDVRLLIGFFRIGPGVKVADARNLAEDIRHELRNDNWKQLYVITREQMNTQLKGSGFPEDEPGTLIDLMAMAKSGLTRANEAIDATLTRTADGKGYRLESQFYYAGNPQETEPLPTIEGKSTGDVRGQFKDMYLKWREQLKEYKTCHSALVGKKWEQVVESGRKLLKARPDGQLGQLCLLSGLAGEGTEAAIKASANEIISLSLKILARDSTNRVALSNMTFASQVTGDSVNFAKYAIRVFALDPSNQANARSAIRALLQAGSPDSALSIVNKMLAANGNDVDAMTIKLNLLRNRRDWKGVLKVAEDLIAIDTAVMTAAFVTDMAGFAQADSNTAGQLVWLERGTKKFTKDVRLWMAYADVLRRSGRLAEALNAARRAFEADPKEANALLVMGVLFIQLDMPDSAIALAPKAIAAGVEKSRVADGLSGILNKLKVKAEDSTQVDPYGNWMELYSKAQQIDSLVPSGTPKFFAGYAAAMLGNLSLTKRMGNVNEIVQKAGSIAKVSAEDKARICSAANDAAKFFDIAGERMRSGGGSGEGFRAAAGEIMLKLVAPNADQPNVYKKAFSC